MGNFGIPSRRKNADGSAHEPDPKNVRFFACRSPGCMSNRAEVETLQRGVVQFRCIKCGHTTTVNLGGGG